MILEHTVHRTVDVMAPELLTIAEEATDISDDDRGFLRLRAEQGRALAHMIRGLAETYGNEPSEELKWTIEMLCLTMGDLVRVQQRKGAEG